MIGRFGGQRHVFGKLVNGFWGSSPKIGDFWPHISPFLLPAGSRNRENLLKYGVTLSNQTYLPMTGRLGGQRHVFGKLVNSFWGSSPIIADFWPIFHLFCYLQAHEIVKTCRIMVLPCLIKLIYP